MAIRSRKKKENTSPAKEARAPPPRTPHTKTSSSQSAARINAVAQRFWEKRRFVLLFGILLGVVFTFYANRESIANLPPLDDYLKMDTLNLDSISMDSMMDYLEDWKDFFPESLKQTISERQREEKGGSGAFAIGKIMSSKGYYADHNVIMVPGVTSTGIESWAIDGPEGCPSEKYFRKRLWGSFYMLRTMLMEKSCWLKHIMLDPETGLDPEGVRLRAAQGFEAADFFVAGYWIWNKILENLAVIGYGPDNMVSAAYDWRLAYLDLERRDNYFSKLKAQIELSNRTMGKKTVLMGHSMGSQIIFYFLKWVEGQGEHFGNAHQGWVNDHIEAFVDISGSVLGTPKAITALLSGEMKDTVQLNGLAVYGLEKFFSRRERSDMLKTFGGIPAMLPKGGDLIWGNMDGAPDDCLDGNMTTCHHEGYDSLGNFMRFADEVGEYSKKNLTMSESIDFLFGQGPEWFKNRAIQNYSYGYSTSRKELEANNNDHTKWSNPLEVQLPNAPDMKIYCFYGVGNPTERAYFYREEQDKATSRLNVTIDSDMKDSVMMSDGDGTVSLLTHYMCHKWKEEDNMYNPGKSKVTIVELLHQPDSYDIRGGSRTAEHVDILGSSLLNELLLKVASGNGDEIEDVYYTTLKDVVARINAEEGK